MPRRGQPPGEGRKGGLPGTHADPQDTPQHRHAIGGATDAGDDPIFIVQGQGSEGPPPSDNDDVRILELDVFFVSDWRLSSHQRPIPQQRSLREVQDLDHQPLTHQRIQVNSP